MSKRCSSWLALLGALWLWSGAAVANEAVFTDGGFVP